MTNYTLLATWLDHQPGDSATLSFAEIEAILDQPLPASARKHQPWWANTASHSQAQAWMRKGFRTRQVRLADEQITFERVRSVPQTVSFDPVRQEPPTGVAEIASSFDITRSFLGEDKSMILLNLNDLLPSTRDYLGEVGRDLGVDLRMVVESILESSARRSVMERFIGRSTFSPVSGVDLIREGRIERGAE